MKEYGVMSINRKVHYCWFGKKPKPDSVLEYIEGWKKKLPEYEIIEWNETNFNIDICKYVREAYDSEKYAFVSDYARLLALYNHGGVYLDTDVEIRKNLAPLLETGKLTFGFEELNFIATSTLIAPKSSAFIKQFLDSYHARSFISSTGELDTSTNVQVLTRLLEGIGLKKNGRYQKLSFEGEDIIVLEQDKLSPFDYINYHDRSSANTYAVHHFSNSWADASSLRKSKIKKIIGKNNLRILRKVFS